MIDEHLLHELVELALHLVVIALAVAPQLGQPRLAQLVADRREGGKGVLGLADRDDVTHQPEKVASPHRVRRVAPEAEQLAEQLLARLARRLAQRIAVLLQHGLVLAHLRQVTLAELPVPRIFRLCRVVFQVLDQRLVLHDAVADLRAKKVSSSFHRPLHG